MGELSKRLMRTASDAHIARWRGLAPGEFGREEITEAMGIAERLVPAVLRELAKESEDLLVHHLGDLANEIEATPSTSEARDG